MFTAGGTIAKESSSRRRERRGKKMVKRSDRGYCTYSGKEIVV